jgi:hypothetical protein
LTAYLYQVWDERDWKVVERIVNETCDIIHISEFHKPDDRDSVFEAEAYHLDKWVKERGLHMNCYQLTINVARKSVEWSVR